MHKRLRKRIEMEHNTDSYRRKQRRANRQIDVVECGVCGYVGPDVEFLHSNPTDMKCPKCGESTELIFTV